MAGPPVYPAGYVAVLVVAMVVVIAVAAAGALVWRLFGPPVYRSLSGTLAEVTEQVRRLERQRARDHSRILALEARQASANQFIVTLLEGIEQLLEQLEQARIRPAWRPPEWGPMVDRKRLTGDEVDPGALAIGMADWFSLEEINTVAFRLGLDPEELSGDEKTSRCRSLVTAVEQRGRSDDLVTMLQAERPHVDWATGKANDDKFWF